MSSSLNLKNVFFLESCYTCVWMASNGSYLLQKYWGGGALKGVERNTMNGICLISVYFGLFGKKEIDNVSTVSIFFNKFQRPHHFSLLVLKLAQIHYELCILACFYIKVAIGPVYMAVPT